MKFVKQVPKKDGYYWMIDLNYPSPKIAFVSSHNNNYFEWGRAIGQLNSVVTAERIRWGDEIQQPDTTKMEYEN